MMIEKIEKSHRLNKRICLLLGPILLMILLVLVVKNAECDFYSKNVVCGSSKKDQYVVVPVTIQNTASTGRSCDISTNTETIKSFVIPPVSTQKMDIKLKTDGSGNGYVNFNSSLSLASQTIGNCIDSPQQVDILLYGLGVVIGVVFIVILRSVFT